MGRLVLSVVVLGLLAQPAPTQTGKPEKTLSPRQAQLVTAINLKTLFELGSAGLRKCTPGGFSVCMLSGPIEAQLVVPRETLRAILGEADAKAPPALLPHALPLSNRNKKARQATQRFWDALHGDDYGQVNQVIADLTAAWRVDPKDPTVTRLLGASHGWKFMERGRANLKTKEVVQHGILCLDFLDKAARLEPNNRMLPGIHEPAKIAKAVMLKDKAGLARSFDTLRQSTQNDPSMHGFVQGWVSPRCWIRAIRAIRKELTLSLRVWIAPATSPCRDVFREPVR